MVENRPFVTFLSHLTVLVGLLIIAFPVWMTFVASTHDQETMLRPPVPIWPGKYMFENYWTVLTEGFAIAPAPCRSTSRSPTAWSWRWAWRSGRS